MCKAIEYTRQLLDIYDSIVTEYESLKQQHSEIEALQQDLLHEIENTNFNACEGYMLAKRIKDVRATRREIKNEVLTMGSLVNGFVNSNMEALKTTTKRIESKDLVLNRLKENGTYNSRVDIVQSKETPLHNGTVVDVIGKYRDCHIIKNGCKVDILGENSTYYKCLVYLNGGTTINMIRKNKIKIGGVNNGNVHGNR